MSRVHAPAHPTRSPAARTRWVMGMCVGLGLAVAVATSCASDPTAGTLPDNVGAAFSSCQESEIKFLSTKHNFQTVFEPCGNNNFVAFTWSPDGTRVYFQLGETGYVMNAAAEDRRVITVPTPAPLGGAAWLSASTLAVPVGPESPKGSNRVALFDVEQQSVFTRDVPHPVVRRAWKGPDGAVLLVVADATEAPLRVVSVDPAEGTVSPALPWLEPGFDTLTVTASANVAVVGRGTTVTVHALDTGATTHTFTPAVRGTVHPDGLWLALEHEGDPVSIFYQRAWDDMTEAQRNRERQRAEKLASGLPESYPTEVSPPILSFVDLRDGARWQLTSVYGNDFEWYEARPYFASFIFWGYEGKQFRRNVLLGQMGNRMRATELGRDFLGVEPMNDVARNRPSPTAQAEGDPAPTEGDPAPTAK